MEGIINMFNNFIEKTIIKSQYCQRNWNLDESIPEKDINTLRISVTQCPSKQNRVFYRVHFITNREIIEKIYNFTDGFMINFQTRETKKNPQTLANLLVAFSDDMSVEEGCRTAEEADAAKTLNEKVAKAADPHRARDADIALGIASGYLTFTANLLGYSTGCCQCFNRKEVGELIGTENTVLLVGVGYPGNINRRIDHKDHNFIFPTFKKNIKVDYV